MKRAGEEGAALLTVLLLVAVLAVLSAVALERLRMGTALAANGASIEQARSYALAAETVARYRIGDLIQRESGRTTLEGDWAGRPTNFPIDGGLATARIDDGGNCFNLNSLVERDQNGTLTARPLAIAQFGRLIALLGADGRTADQVAVAAADWIDSDIRPLPGGAEDSAYETAGRTDRTANTLMAEASELRVVAGVTPGLYSRLRPLVCALPVTDLSAINVNTLRIDQAPLLAMLVAGLDPARAAAAIGLRPQIRGYESLSAFWNLPPLAAVGADIGRDQAKLATRWFDVTLDVELQGAELHENALIDAQMKPGKLVYRSYGERG